MGSFSVGGLATGLDTKSIIDQLMRIDARPKTMLEWKSQLWSARKNAWSDLNNRLLSLQNSANALLRPETWSATGTTSPFTASSSDAAVGVRVTGTPVAGSWNVDVQQLAQGEVSTSTGTLPAATSGVRSSGAWYEAANDVVEGDESFLNLTTVNGQRMNFDLGSKVTMSFSVNGVAQTAQFTVNSQANGGNGTTLADFTAWVAGTVGNGATAAYSGGQLQVTTAPGTASELGGMSFSAVNSTGAALNRFNGSAAASSTTTTAATNGGISANDTLTIASGSGSWDVAVAAGDRAADIVRKINNTAGVGVAASLDTNGNIVLASKSIGAASAFSVSSVGGAAAQLGFVETQSAQDARYAVDGAVFTSANNSNVSGAIAGITLDLNAIASTTVTVEENPPADQAMTDAWVSKTKARIQDFVKEYNAVLDMIHQRTQGESRVANPKTLNEFLQGPMARDVGFSQVGFDLRRLASDRVEGIVDGPTMLSQIGITTSFAIGGAGSNGKLVIDDEKLDAALRANPSQVQAVLTRTGGVGVSADDGIVRRLSEQVSLLRVGGRVDSSMNGAGRQVKNIQDAVDRAGDRLDRRKLYYERMFSNLESRVGVMQSQGAWLSGQLNALMSSSNKGW